MTDKYDDIFRSAGEKYNVNGLILKSIAQVESNFRDDIISGQTKSKAGAVGMMQFMPGTLQGLKNNYGVDIDPTDPESAINGAGLLLNELITKYEKQGSDNPLRDALEDYNGGPSLVGKSSQTAKYRDDVLQIAQQTLNQKAQLQQQQQQPQQQAPAAPPMPTKKKIDVNNPVETTLNITKGKVAPKENNKEFNLESDENFLIIKEYLESRIGKDNLGLSEEEDGREAYTDAFLNHMREVEFNTTTGGVPELNYLYNTSDSNVIKAARAHELYDKMPNFYDGIGETVKDVTYEIFTDPTNYLSAGIGGVLKFKLAREGIKAAIKARIKKDIIKDNVELDASKAKTGAERAYLNKQINKKVEEQYSNLTKEDITKLGKKEKNILNTKLMAIGGGVEAAVAMNSEVIALNIDKELELREQAVALTTQYNAGLISYEDAKKEIEKVKKETSLSNPENLTRIALNTGLGLGLGALSARVAGSDFVMGKVENASSKELYEQSLDAFKTTPKTKIDFDGLEKMYAQELDKEVINSFAESIDYDKIDYSKLKFTKEQAPKLYGKKINAKMFKKAVERGDVPLEKLLEADIQDVIPKELKDKGSFTQAIMDRNILRKSFYIATKIMAENPERYRNVFSGFAHKEVKVSQILSNVFSDLAEGQIDQTSLGNALQKAGLTQKEFDYALKVSSNKAGGMLSELSQLSKALRKYVDLNPDLQGLADLSFANRKMQDSASAYTRFFDNVKNFERNSKALVVSSVATTVRNVMGTTTALGLDSATKLLDIGLYSITKGVSDVLGGKAQYKYIDNKSIIENATFNLTQLQGIAEAFTVGGQKKLADQFDLVLGDQPYTRNLLLNSLQETGDQNKLWKFSRVANTFNVAQDAFFRRALFINSIKRQIDSAPSVAGYGKTTLEQMLANKQAIPRDIIDKAADEALLGTFAKLPDTIVNPKGLEEKLETMASGLIKSLENLPGSSLIIPFPRFMANAMAFQYKYSIFQFAKFGSSMSEGHAALTKGMQKLKDDIAFNKDLLKRKAENKLTDFEKQNFDDVFRKGANPPDEEALLRQQELMAAQLFAKGRQELSRGIVGTSLVLAAYQYRKDNQNEKWYLLKTADGATIDIRAIFPMAPFLALADAIVKIREGEGKYDAKELSSTMESLAGTKLPATGLSQTFSDIIETFTGGEDPGSVRRVNKLLGELVGDFANRFQQPFQPVYGFFDAFDKEFATARDSTVMDTQDAGKLFWETASNRFFNRGSAALQAGFAELTKDLNPFSEQIEAYLPDVKFKYEMPPVLRKFDSTSSVRSGEFFNVFQGFRETPRVNDLEQLFKDLNVAPWPIYASSGDPEYDRQVVLESYKYIFGDNRREGEVILKTLGNGPAAQWFRSLKDKNVQADELHGYLSKAVSKAREEVDLKLQAREGFDPKAANKRAKIWLSRQSPRIRRAIINKSKEYHPEGKSIVETGSYKDAYYLNQKIYELKPYDQPFSATENQSD